MNTDVRERMAVLRKGVIEGLSKLPRRISILVIFSAVLAIWVIAPDQIAYGALTRSGRQGRALPAGSDASRAGLPLQQVAQDLSIQKSHTGNFQIGATGSYLITVTNVGTSSITGEVTVTDVLPNGLTPTQASGDGWTPCGFSGQTVVCTHHNLNGLAPGISLPPITILVSVGAVAAPSVTNAASLTNVNDTNPTNNLASDTTIITSADLAVTKIVTSTVPSELTPVGYILTLRNNGPSNATGVVLTDTLPSGLTFVTASTTRGTYNPLNGLWSVGNLDVKELVTLRITAQVNADTRGLTIVNTTNGLKSDLYDYNTANNLASASLRVLSTRLIGIVSDLGSGQPIVSARLTFTDSLNRVYTTTTAASGWYTFTDTLSRPIAAGNYSIKASKSGYRPTTIFSALTANVDNRQDISLGTADLLVTKRDNLSTVVPGQTFTYTLAITNVGSIPANQIVITDVLPTTLTYITDTLGVAHTTPVAGTIVWKPTTTLATGSRLLFRMRVRVADALPSPTASIKNTITARTGSPEANLTNNTAEDTNTSTGSPTINITKSVSPSQVRTGQNATYTIVVNNTGNAMATSVSVSDQFSSLVDIVSATTTKGTATTTASTRRVTVNIGTLSPNETVTITVVTRVNTSALVNTTVSNFATVTYVFGGSTFTRTSNSVTFQLLVTSTLPGTGGIEPEHNPMDTRSKALWTAVLSALLLGVLGLFALGYAFRARSRGMEATSWLFRMSAMLLAAGVVFALLAWGLKNLAERRAIIASAVTDQPTQATLPLWDSPPTEAPIVMPPSQLDTLESLPDFPIPTPTVLPSLTEGESAVDTTPVTRIVIPAIAEDTVVKYVPFDGNTWLIAGLKQEVAWMGDTSWPGLGSNTALAGHVTLRTGEDGPFRYLDQLQPGDEVSLYTEQNLYKYTVRSRQQVDETDLSVVAASEKPQITLITCAGWDAQIRYYVKRLVVVADLTSVTPLQTASRGN